MNKTINKPSITKKQVWSLILEIKSIFNNFKRNQKTLLVSKKINNDNLRLTYSFDKQKIINKNFKVNNINEELFNIFLPIILNKSKEPYIIGHLAQTLDGYIATQAGESKYISCRENIEHIHRLRAISDIIIVGSKTVLLDNPKLTTRMVEGSNPLRMVLNSKNNLNNNLNIFAHKDRNGFKVINKNEQTKMNNVFSLPYLFFSIFFIAYLHSKNVDPKFISITLFHSSSFILNDKLSIFIPALLTKISKPVNCDETFSINSSILE